MQSTDQINMDCPARLEEVVGDLLEQDVDVIVNAWNRNFIPWWLLLPQGVSGAIKKRAGYQPFRELGKMGLLPVGHAVLTSAGRLPYKAIIHVAGLNMLWRATETSVSKSVANALDLACERGFSSIAIPLIGTGSGGLATDRVRSIIIDQVQRKQPPIDVTVVTYRKKKHK